MTGIAFLFGARKMGLGGAGKEKPDAELHDTAVTPS